MSTWKHPNAMTREELRDVVSDLAWMGLDLAQHLELTERGLEPEDQPKAREEAIAMAYGLAWYPYSGPSDRSREHARSSEVDVAFFGGSGLQCQRVGYDDLAQTTDEPEDGADRSAVAGDVERDEPRFSPRGDPEVRNTDREDGLGFLQLASSTSDHSRVDQQTPATASAQADAGDDPAASIAETERTVADIRDRLLDRERETRSDQFARWSSDEATSDRQQADTLELGDPR